MADLKCLAQDVVGAIASTSAVDTLSEYIESGIDSLLDEGVLKEIPIVGTLTSLARAGIAISDRLLLRKIAKLLTGLSSLSVNERVLMVQRLEDDPEYGRSVGEHVIEILDKIDSKRKPEIVAAVFTAYAKRQIGSPMLHRLTIAIERLPGIDIDRVRPFVEGEAEEVQPDALLGQELVAAGLALGLSAFDGVFFKPSDAGRTFTELALDRVGV